VDFLMLFGMTGAANGIDRQPGDAVKCGHAGWRAPLVSSDNNILAAELR
jgi:hypothetical protein